jgi:hypothetical protein
MMEYLPYKCDRNNGYVQRYGSCTTKSVLVVGSVRKTFYMHAIPVVLTGCMLQYVDTHAGKARDRRRVQYFSRAQFIGHKKTLVVLLSI